MTALKYTEWGVVVLLALGAYGLWRQRKLKPPGWRAFAAAWCALLMLCWSPFATLAMATLEWRAPERPAVNPGAQVMVVLAGGLIMPLPPEPGVAAASNTLVRCLHAAWLYQNGWRMPILVTGGETIQGQNYAAVMEEILHKEGVPAADVRKEDRADSTYDSALRIAAMLHPQGIRKILLVTEAYHMPRSIRMFERAGFEVVASPCAFRTREFQLSWVDWLLPGSKSIRMFEAAWHEWMATAWGKVRGRL